jgi:hypothetical protein
MKRYKVGNLFEMARNILEKKRIPFHFVDVIDLAIRLRKELDVSPIRFYRKYHIKKEPKLTKEELRRNHNISAKKIRDKND